MSRSLVCVLGLVGVTVACRPGPAGESTAIDPAGGGSSVVDGGGDPYREPLDVPVINASRGELGPTSPVWTGSEAVFFTSSLWVGRMDAEGRELGRVQLPIEGTVSMETYPVWRGGTISAVFETYPPGPGGPKARWISARPDGTLASDVRLEAAPGWFLFDRDVIYRKNELLVVTGMEQAASVREPPRTGIATFDATGKRTASVPFDDCWVPRAMIGTSWGYVVECLDSSGPTRVVGFRGGAVIWTHEIADGGKAVLGSDGQRTLVVHSVERADSFELDDVVKIELLDADGAVLKATLAAAPELDSHPRPLVWTGREYAAVSGQWIYRYSGDGELIGVWALEPQCRRWFTANGLVWTGTAYLVTGDWRWQNCEDTMDGIGRIYAEASKLKKPLAPGLRWDPAADALEPPDDEDW